MQPAHIKQPVLFRGIRSSKFKHVYGSAVKKEKCYDNVAITKNAHDCSQFCAVNPKFVAIVTESSGGGSFIVIPIDFTGRQDVDAGRVTGHRGPVLDIKWNPFNDNLIASASEDATIKIWHIPDMGPPRRGISDALVTLAEHKRRVSMIEWHPIAENILISAGFDCLIMIWHTSKAYLISIINCHPDTIQSMSLNRSGNLLATTCKDKVLRVIDLREGLVKSEGIAHEGPKSTKVVFLGDSGKLFSTGFSRYSDRQWAVWDMNDLSLPLRLENIDSSSGVLFPFYDHDTKMVYVAGKGDGSIRYYEVTDHSPYCYYINQFMTGYPQRGLGIMPKRGLNTGINEVFRVYKLHATKPVVEPISFIVPRKSQVFQDDLYPDTAAPTPALTAEEWISGKNHVPILMSMKNTPSDVVKTNKVIMYNRVYNGNENDNNTYNISNHHQNQHQQNANSNIARSRSAKDFWNSANNLVPNTGGYPPHHPNNPANQRLIMPSSRYFDGSYDASAGNNDFTNGYTVMSSSINNDRKFAFLRQVDPIDYRPKVLPRTDSQEILLRKSATIGALVSSRDSSSGSSSDSGSNNASSPPAEMAIIDEPPIMGSRFIGPSSRCGSSQNLASISRSNSFSQQQFNPNNPAVDSVNFQQAPGQASPNRSANNSQPPSPRAKQHQQSLPNQQQAHVQQFDARGSNHLNHQKPSLDTVDDFIATYGHGTSPPKVVTEGNFVNASSRNSHTNSNSNSNVINSSNNQQHKFSSPQHHPNHRSGVQLRRCHSLKFTGWPIELAPNDVDDDEYLAFINRRSSYHSGYSNNVNSNNSNDNNGNSNHNRSNGNIASYFVNGCSPSHRSTPNSSTHNSSVNHSPQRQFTASRFTIPRKPSDIKFKKCHSAANLLDASMSDDDGLNDHQRQHQHLRQVASVSPEKSKNYMTIEVSK